MKGNSKEERAMNNELKEKLIKAKNKEELVTLLKAEGQDISEADKIWEEIVGRKEKAKAKAKEEEGKTLSLDELEAVSGGILGLGDDAPDGHELNCIFTWYHGWDDFDNVNKDKYCAGTKGRKHVYEHIEYVKQYGIIDPTDMTTEYDICTLCGHKINEKFYRTGSV